VLNTLSDCADNTSGGALLQVVALHAAPPSCSLDKSQSSSAGIADNGSTFE
jgi:hypothetical protein